MKNFITTIFLSFLSFYLAKPEQSDVISKVIYKAVDTIAEYQAEKYGTGYIISILNNTLYPANLSFYDNGDGYTIKPGQSIGEEPDPQTAKYNPTLIGRNAIKISNEKTISNTKASRKPSISGYSESTLQKFTQLHTLLLLPLKGAGGAYAITYDTSPPFAIEFEIETEESGMAGLLFSKNEKSGSADVQILFGAKNNSAIQILINNQVVEETNLQENNGFSIISGTKNNYWCNIDNQGIIVGKGNIGEKVLLFHQNKEIYKDIKRTGFVSYEKPIKISNINYGPPVKIASFGMWKEFNQPPTTKLTFKSKGNGCLKFDRSQILKSPAIRIKSNETEIGTIFFSSSKSLRFENSEVKKQILLPDGIQNISVSIIKNSLMIISEDTDNKSLLGIINYKKLTTSDSFEVIKNLDTFSVGPSPLICYNTETSVDEKSGPKFEGTIKIIRPYNYVFDQQGPSITCTNTIDDQTFMLGSAPQQGAAYSFRVEIKNSGEINLKWVVDPVNPGRIAMKMAAATIRLGGEFLFMKADDSVNDDVDIREAAKLTAKNIGYSTAATTVNTTASVLDVVSENNYRNDKTSFVLKEEMKITTPEDLLSDDVKAAKKFIESNIAALAATDIKKRSDFDYYFSTLKQILSNATIPQAISNGSRLKLIQIMQNLIWQTQIYSKKTTELDQYKNRTNLSTDNLANMVLSFLLECKDNPYLAPYTSAAGKNLRITINSGISAILSDIIQNSESFFLPKTENQILWINQRLDTTDGSVITKARGSGNFYVVFAAQDVKNFLDMFGVTSNADLLLTSFGNEKSEISISTSTDKENGFITKNKNELALNDLDFTTCCCDFKNQELSLFVNSLTNKAVSFKTNWENKEPLEIGIWQNNGSFEINGFSVNKSTQSLSENMISLLTTKQLSIVAKEKYLEIKNKKSEQINTNFTLGSGLLSKIKFSEKSSFNIVLSTETNPATEEPNQKIINVDFQNGKVKITDDDDEENSSTFKVDQNNESWFFMELDKNVLSITFAPFWTEDAMFQTFFGCTKNEPIKIQINDLQGSLTLHKFETVETRKKLPFNIFALFNNDITAPDLNKAEKEKANFQQAQIQNMIDDYLNNDPLLNDLAKEDKQKFADIITYAAMNDLYDDLTYDPIEWDLLAKTSATENDLLQSYSLGGDILTADGFGLNQKKDELKKEEDSSEETTTGAEARLQSAGLAGSLTQIKGEIAGLTEFAKDAAIDPAKAALRKAGVLKNAAQLYEEDGKKIRAEARKNGEGELTDEQVNQRRTRSKDDIEESHRLKFFGVRKNLNQLQEDVGSLADFRDNQYKPERHAGSGAMKKDDAGNIMYKTTKTSSGEERFVNKNIFKEYGALIDDSFKKLKKKSPPAKKSGGQDVFAAITAPAELANEIQKMTGQVKQASEGKRTVRQRISSAAKSAKSKIKNTVKKVTTKKDAQPKEQPTTKQAQEQPKSSQKTDGKSDTTNNQKMRENDNQAEKTNKDQNISNEKSNSSKSAPVSSKDSSTSKLSLKDKLKKGAKITGAVGAATSAVGGVLGGLYMDAVSSKEGENAALTVSTSDVSKQGESEWKENKNADQNDSANPATMSFEELQQLTKKMQQQN